MFYGWLADLVVAMHLAFIVFVAAGGLLALRWPRAPWIHLPMMGWGAFVELSGHICPLTPLESRLRAAAGEQGYEGDFVGRYLLPIIYPGGLTPAIQATLGIGVLVLNALIYFAVWRRRSGRVGPNG
jgi:hypothetical protein